MNNMLKAIFMMGLAFVASTGAAADTIQSTINKNIAAAGVAYTGPLQAALMEFAIIAPHLVVENQDRSCMTFQCQTKRRELFERAQRLSNEIRSCRDPRPEVIRAHRTLAAAADKVASCANILIFMGEMDALGKQSGGPGMSANEAAAFKTQLDCNGDRKGFYSAYQQFRTLIPELKLANITEAGEVVK